MADPISPKRVPSSVYRAPPAQGPGPTGVRLVRLRLAEVGQVILNDVTPTEAAVGARQKVCAQAIDRCAAAQLSFAGQFQQADQQSSSQMLALVTATAKEALRTQQFETPSERIAAEEKEKQRMAAKNSKLVEAGMLANRTADAELARKTRGALLDAREAIVRARFEADVDVDAEADPKFAGRAEALRQRAAGLPLFKQSAFAAELQARAIQLGDDDRRRLIEFALLPLMVDQVGDGAARLRQAVASMIGRAGAADAAINAASLFVTRARRPMRTALDVAGVVQRELEKCFAKVLGVDFSDPASVGPAEYKRYLSGNQRQDWRASEDLPIDTGESGLSWLTRPLRSKQPLTLAPWAGLVRNPEFAQKAGAK